MVLLNEDVICRWSSSMSEGRVGGGWVSEAVSGEHAISGTKVYEKVYELCSVV